MNIYWITQTIYIFVSALLCCVLFRYLWSNQNENATSKGDSEPDVNPFIIFWNREYSATTFTPSIHFIETISRHNTRTPNNWRYFSSLLEDIEKFFVTSSLNIFLNSDYAWMLFMNGIEYGYSWGLRHASVVRKNPRTHTDCRGDKDRNTCM